MIEFFGDMGIDMEAIKGGGGGVYEVKPEDTIPYEMIRFFYIGENTPENDPNGFMKYYEYPTEDNVKGNMLEIYGQKFLLGEFFILWHTLNFWRFYYDKEEYFCIVSQTTGAWCPHPVLIFNITNKNNIALVIKYHTYAYENGLYDYPHIGLYPKNDPFLCVLQDEFIENIGTFIRLYKIVDTHLEPVLDNNGRNIEIQYSFNKWDEEMFKIIEKNIPPRGSAPLREDY
jgi:hypothetical protein